MKRISIFVLAALIAIVWALQTSSLAQKPQTSSSTAQKKRPATRAKPTPTPVPDMRAEASQVATQIKNVSNFIYVYGKIVNALEIDEDQVQHKETSPEIQAKIKKSKKLLIARIRDLQTGLENVATGFQANPRLQVQYLKLTHATDAVLNAQRLASTGQYDEAGKSLVAAVERLTDTMVSMRLL